MRARKQNKHLPPNVHIKSGTYYYVDKNRKWINIGKTLSEAMSNWIKIVEPIKDSAIMAQLFDRYMLEVAPNKSAASYKANKIQITNLYAAFGSMSPKSVTPVHVYQFLDARLKKAPVAANREKALLSHVYSMAIRWGIVTDNPCKNVKRITEKRRNRYITDEEFKAVYTLAPKHLKNLLHFAYLTGVRQGDILKIKLVDIEEEGVLIHISKTKNKILIEWTEQLKKVVDEAKTIAIEYNSEYLFPNLSGNAYTSCGFRAVWRKIVVKALEEKSITQAFRFHDIRRKTATDIEKTAGRENARQLLGHSDQKTTGIYISGVQRVKPLD